MAVIRTWTATSAGDCKEGEGGGLLLPSFSLDQGHKGGGGGWGNDCRLSEKLPIFVHLPALAPPSTSRTEKVHLSHEGRIAHEVCAQGAGTLAGVLRVEEREQGALVRKTDRQMHEHAHCQEEQHQELRDERQGRGRECVQLLEHAEWQHYEGRPIDLPAN